jgi:hypothetical protein
MLFLHLTVALLGTLILLSLLTLGVALEARRSGRNLAAIVLRLILALLLLVHLKLLVLLNWLCRLRLMLVHCDPFV